MTDDMVNHPPHYKQGEIECKDSIKSMLGNEGYLNYCRGQVQKYNWRAPHKGKPIEDYKKAQFYLQEIINLLQGIN